MSDAGWWTELGRFWDRSTGGRDVAANLSPADHSAWPTAPRASGIDEAVAWLKSDLGDSQIPRLVYLVGGPGAGKSHAAASVVAGLTALGKPSILADRTYLYEHPKSSIKFVVVNDATISSEEFVDAPLTAETVAAVAHGARFLGCVNRGILVEELADLRKLGVGSHESAGAATIEWLHRSTYTEDATAAAEDWTIKSVPGGEPYFRVGSLYEGNGIRAHVVAVYVDVNSLLEKAPTVSLVTNEDDELAVVASSYAVSEFARRMTSDSFASPADSLFDDVVGDLRQAPTTSLIDPFVANVESLRLPAARRGITSILRAAEIVASQRLTYREMWGALSRCLIGAAHTKFNSDELEAFVISKQPDLSDDESQRFAKIRALAEFRFSQAIFGSLETGNELERDPLLRVTHLVDPARDAIPGHLTDPSDLGWASPVADAFSGDVGADSPLETLCLMSGSDSHFVPILTEFDRGLDSAFMAYVDKASERDRQEASAWYGAYLIRLYAIAHGIPAFRREITAWTAAWRLATNLPTTLRAQLTTLLKPARYPEKGGGIPLYPIFESRTNPIRGDQAAAKLAISSEVGNITSETDSDSLFVVIGAPNVQPTRMLLDFAMVREAMASSSGHAGATELTATTSPRLERFRAARLVPSKQSGLSDYRIVTAASDSVLTVGNEE